MAFGFALGTCVLLPLSACGGNAETKGDGSVEDAGRDAAALDATVDGNVANDATVDGYIADVPQIPQSPELSGIESAPLTYTKSSPAAAVTAALSITDADSSSLNAAVIAITSGYVMGEDQLAVPPGALGCLAADFDAGSGELEIIGRAEVGDYQVLLRSVEFSSTGSNTGMKTLTFQVTDSDELVSNQVSRKIDVQP